MDLKEIRVQIERELVHAPDIKAHRDDLNRVATRCHNGLIASAAWPFRERLHRMRAYPDTTILDAAWVIPGGLDWSFRFPRGTVLQVADVDWLEGQVVVGPWGEGIGTPKETGRHDDGRYIIERAEWASGTNEITLTVDPRYKPPAAGKGDITGIRDLVIEFPRYRLPSDCEEVLGVMARNTNNGEVQQLSLPRERDLMLNASVSPGTPRVYLTDPSRATLWASSQISRAWEELENVPPWRQPAAVSSDSAPGVLTAGRKYRYKIAWRHSGRISAAGPEVEITIGVGHDTVTLSGLDVLDDVSGNAAMFKRRRVVLRQEAEGPWFVIAEIANPTTSTFVDDGVTARLLERSPGGFTRWRDVRREGGHGYIRFWPKPSAVYEVEMRYLSRPRELEIDQDTPDMPPQYHQWIVHAALVQLAARNKATDLLAVHRKLADDIEAAMRRKLLNEDGGHDVRRSWTSDFEHGGSTVPVVTFTG